MTFTEDLVREKLFAALDALGPKRRVLALPPDATRGHSRAGLVLKLLHDYYGPALTDVMPALGTHEPMSTAEIATMYPGVPASLFRAHDWRHDLVTLGRVPAAYVKELSEGKLDFDWPAQVNRLVAEGGHDLIVSIGQVVPHEVAGMANHAKNVFVGTGGAEGIHRSHFLGAVYGMERMMGRADTPVRALFDYASREFASGLPIFYALTVVGPEEEGADPVAGEAFGAAPGARANTGKSRRIAEGEAFGAAPGARARRDVLRGFFVGQGRRCFEEAAALSASLNVNLLDRPIRRALVRLDPEEFKSTWLGNKAVYRTRMAMADGGELIILAPGLRRFGEDPTIDRLIRKHGYRGTPATLAAVDRDPELAANLSGAAHLIHGSSEGRFSITYCAPGLSREEVEGVGFRYGDLAAAEAGWRPSSLSPGFNEVDGEEVFWVPNPALGLWATKERFGAP
ncbi:MAG TPA: lactate racemase domain-containing protein [Rectinemataceae bacterium]|nr:lactate racemase domain-containing protein [Rectinemataceae bacterium]